MTSYNWFVLITKHYLPHLSEGCQSEHVAVAGETVKINKFGVYVNNLYVNWEDLAQEWILNTA
jgi:hypothetical protein